MQFREAVANKLKIEIFKIAEVRNTIPVDNHVTEKHRELHVGVRNGNFPYCQTAPMVSIFWIGSISKMTQTAQQRLPQHDTNALD